MNYVVTCLLVALFAMESVDAQEPITLLTANRVFDGERMHLDWAVAVRARK